MVTYVPLTHLGSRSHKLRPKLCCNCTISLHEIWEVMFWHCFISFHFLLMGGLNSFLNLGRAKGRSILSCGDSSCWAYLLAPESGPRILLHFPKVFGLVQFLLSAKYNPFLSFLQSCPFLLPLPPWHLGALTLTFERTFLGSIHFCSSDWRKI